MIIAKKSKAWVYAFICTFSSVLGGVVGYAIGYFFYNSIGILIIDAYHLSNSFSVFENYYNEYGILSRILISHDLKNDSQIGYNVGYNKYNNYETI